MWYKFTLYNLYTFGVLNAFSCDVVLNANLHRHIQRVIKLLGAGVINLIRKTPGNNIYELLIYTLYLNFDDEINLILACHFDFLLTLRIIVQFCYIKLFIQFPFFFFCYYHRSLIYSLKFLGRKEFYYIS